MSLRLPTLEDDVTPDPRAYNGYTAAEYETLGLNPNVNLQAYVFPPLPPTEIVPSSSSYLSPRPLSSSHPLSERSYSNTARLNRYICDLYTPVYEPQSSLWTLGGEIPRADTNVEVLTRHFPQYRRLVSAVKATPHNSRNMKKVKDLIVRYIKEEREKSWGSLTIDPRLTWQEQVLEKRVSTSHTRTHKLVGLKRVLKERRPSGPGPTRPRLGHRTRVD